VKRLADLETAQVDEADAVATVAASGGGVTPPNLAAWEEFKSCGSERVANLFGSLRLYC